MPCRPPFAVPRGREMRGGHGRRRSFDRQAGLIDELGLPLHEMRALLDAHDLSEGRITEVYLAWLALAYEIAARDHRDVSMRIAAALNRPLQTVKGHLVRARKKVSAHRKARVARVVWPPPRPRTPSCPHRCGSRPSGPARRARPPLLTVLLPPMGKKARLERRIEKKVKVDDAADTIAAVRRWVDV